MAVTTPFDETKPADNSDLISLSMREQFLAQQSGIVGLEGNMVRDCGFKIRPAGENAAAAHWRFDASAGQAITYAGTGLSDTIRKAEPACAKITSAAGTDGLLEQTLIGTSGFDESWQNRWITVGAHLRCGTANKLQIGIYDGVTEQATAFVAVTGGFVWMQKVLKLGNAADRIVLRARIVSGTITGYVADAAVRDGAVPLIGPIPSRTGRFFIGAPTQIGNLTVGTFLGGWGPRALIPFIVRRVELSAGTAPTGTDAVLDANKNGNSMYAGASGGNRPKLPAGGPANGGSAPDGTLANRCFAIGDKLTLDQDSVGSGTAGADQTVTIEAQSFIAPQDVRLAYDEVG